MNTNTTSLVVGIAGLVIVGGIIYYLVERPNAFSPRTMMEGALYDTRGPGSDGNAPGAGGGRVAGARPVVQTTGFASVASTTAVVVGAVNPRGAATTYWFEYGPTISFGQIAETSTAGSGSTLVGAGAYLTGLKPNTQYYFRVGAQNAHGRVYGAVYSFITAAK